MAGFVGGAITTRARLWQEPALFGAASLLVIAACLLPFIALGVELVSAGSISSLLLSANTWALLGTSVSRAAAVMVGTLVIGIPLAVLCSRGTMALRRAILLLHALPLFVPPFLLALGWFHLLGREGVIGSAFTSQVLFSEVGAVVVQILAFTPVVTSLGVLGLAGVDVAYEDAARAVGSPWRVLTRVSLPLAWPSIATAGLVVFALAFAEIGVPMFLRLPAYPAMVFTRLGGIAYAPGEAFTLVLPLVGVALLILACERQLSRRSVGSARLSLAGARMSLGTYAPLFQSVAWGVVLLSLAPVAGLMVSASDGQGFGQVVDWLGGSLSRSMTTAVVAATLTTLVGSILAWSLARRRPLASLVDAAAVLAFVTPAAVLGVGLIAIWNRPTTSLIYGTSAILVVGYIARYAILGVRVTAAGVRQTSSSLEDAAAVAGASFVRRFARITVPLHYRAMLVAWLLTLVFCLRDLEATVLYYPPGGETLPVRIFTLEANGPEPLVAALALLQIGVTALVIALGAATLFRRRG